MPGEEVICLSSDEEEDLPRKNLVDCDSSPSKIQITPSVQLIKRENSDGKRKAPIKDEVSLKKVKVDLTGIWLDTKTKTNDNHSQNTKESLSVACISSDKKDNKRKSLDETCVASTSNGQKRERLSTESSTSALSEGKSRRVKPTLVVKAKEPVNVENGHESVFSMFISQCLTRERTSDMHKVVEKLKRKYEQLDTEYANSEVFVNLLNEKRNLLLLEQGSLYMHIKDVLDEMKIKKAGRKIIEPEPEPTDADVDEDTDMLEAERKEYRKQETKIRKLEKTMELVRKRIKQLEEAEVDWDDEDDSGYMKLERYKRRMIELYNAWCKLTDNHEDAGRSYLRPKHVKLTGFLTVDQAINSFVNSRLKKRSSLSNRTGKDDFFPDYVDILNLIHSYNEKINLGLSKQAESSAAKKAFIKLGEYLKKERQQDYYDTFSLWYENHEDPAQNNPELMSQLQENRKEGEKKLNEIFEEYTRKQEELNASGKTSEVNETDDENDDDDEEDEGDDEKDVSDAEIVDVESDSNATDPDVDKENGVKNSENDADEKIEEKQELEIVETTETAQVTLKTQEIKAVDKENLPSTSKQATAIASTSSINNSDKLNDESKVTNTDDDEQCDDEADDKPLLKLRSFAKPPGSWANSQEIKDSDLRDKPSIRKNNLNDQNDSSIEVIELDSTEEKSPVTAKKIHPVSTLPKGKIIKRIVPVSAANVCRLSSATSNLKSPITMSTPNPNRVTNTRVVASSFTPRLPMATSTPIHHAQPSSTASAGGFHRVSNFTPRYPIVTSTPVHHGQSSNTGIVNTSHRVSNLTPRFPMATSTPMHHTQPSNTASAGGFHRDKSEQTVIYRHHNSNNNNLNNNSAAGRQNYATSNSLANGRPAVTLARIQSGKNNVNVNVNNSRVVNSNSNSNSNIKNGNSNSDNRHINRNVNLPKSNINNGNAVAGGSGRVLNPLAAQKNVQRPVNKTDKNVSYVNRPPLSNGHMS